MAIPAWVATILGKSIATTVGKSIEKIVDYIPGRGESLRKERRRIVEEMAELQKNTPFIASKYERLSHRLSEIDKTLADKA